MIKLHYASFIFLLPLGCPLCFRCCRCACRQAGNAATPRTARTRPMSLGSPSPRTAPPAGAFRFSPHLVHLGALQCHCNATAMHFVQRLTPKVWTCGRVCYISHSMPEKLKKWTMRGSIGFFWHNWVSEGFPLKRSCLEVPPSCYMGWRISPNDGLKNYIFNDVGMRFQSCQAPLQISKDGGRQTSPWLRDPVSGQPRRVRHRISSASMLFTFWLLTASKDMLW